VTIGAVFGPILAAGRAAYTAWNKPRLRLDLPAPFLEPKKRRLQIVENGDRWQVVFTLTLMNQGKSPARNWRVRFVTPDADTNMYLNRGSDRRSVTDAVVGPGWQHEVQAASPSDTVPPKMPVPIIGRHTLNFRDKPESVSVKFYLTADGMKDYEGTLRLQLHWTQKTARFRLD
jgi:hypothetical protein